MMRTVDKRFKRGHLQLSVWHLQSFRLAIVAIDIVSEVQSAFRIGPGREIGQDEPESARSASLDVLVPACIASWMTSGVHWRWSRSTYCASAIGCSMRMQPWLNVRPMRLNRWSRGRCHGHRRCADSETETSPDQARSATRTLAERKSLERLASFQSSAVGSTTSGPSRPPARPRCYCAPETRDRSRSLAASRPSQWFGDVPVRAEHHRRHVLAEDRCLVAGAADDGADVEDLAIALDGFKWNSGMFTLMWRSPRSSGIQRQRSRFVRICRMRASSGTFIAASVAVSRRPLTERP